MHEWFGSHMFFMPLSMILFWGLFIFLMVWLVKSVIQPSNRDSKTSPLDIAKERYAKGEISKDELNEIRKNIT